MSQENKEKKGKFGLGCIIGAGIAAIVTFIGGVIIVGILALIAAPTLLNAADKAKEGAVKANVSAAASTVTTNLTIKGYSADQAALEAITNLNNGGTPDDPSDDAISPFDITLPAFSDTPGPGVVTLKPSKYAVEITGYNKATEVINKKTVEYIPE